ncbi:DUF1987 domain-containing protein [Fulvivirgaceae bacterium BMA10]|uniref:DUF1987 domain-containing protein n=1 Tax=Splendidivirga corallicola TaxID=3051826 RepID=A0ABT8KYT5_9BACT|nr:DUF1987 domain-containing protein [Fulvivirgaceae bacterium BMA10]
MESFSLEPTQKTPKLFFDPSNGAFEISGRSIPENSIEFYRPLLNWLDEYIKSPNKKTELKIMLEYFNTSSSKCLVEIFRRLQKIHQDGEQLHIEWHYEEEDDDILESGQDFKEIMKLPIEMVRIDTDY